jgi:membrane peptidoglycan carboxypeptidase
MVNSSNIGMSLIEQKLGNQNFYEMIDCSGFGHPTHVDYPGESIGTVPDLLDWNIVSQANMSFGQGLQVSSLQVASFYGAIANYGVQIRPHFLLARPNENESPSYGATRIMSQYTAEQLESILRSVVEIHAPVANVDGYQVVGKTGTAEKASSDGGYLYNNHIVSFVGYMANSSSQMVCLTSFDNPLEQLTAPPTQPLFKEIMAFLANRSMVAQVDAVYEAKAALAAAAAAGEINGVATSDTNANAAGSTNGQGSATTGSNQSGQQSGSADTNEQAANSERLRSSLPQAYSVSDPAARPILAGTSEGWVLDTSG